jgi:hypothetical protein
VSQFGPVDLPAGFLSWRLVDEAGRTTATGVAPYPALHAGGLRDVGELKIPLSTAGQYSLKLRLGGTQIETSYPLWVFSDREELTAPNDLLIARGYDQTVRETLAQGGRVLIVCDDRPLASSVGGGFAPDFWNFPMFHGKPGTMGLLCDPKTPALAGFPNEGRSDWRWASIAMASQPLILDDVLAKGQVPIVQVIDNYARCHKLGLIAEFQVGAGRLLVCASDLIQLRGDHPEAGALLQSLIDYASSDRFHPAVSASPEMLADLLRLRLKTDGWTVSASSFDNHWHGYQPEQIIDANESRGWRAAEPGPAWCRIEFPEAIDLDEGEIVWSRDDSAHRYSVEYSPDGANWQILCDRQDQPPPGNRHRLVLKTGRVKALRINVDPVEADAVAEIMEIHLFDARLSSTRPTI